MPDISQLTNALNTYDGSQDSMINFASLAQQILGDNWFSVIYEAMGTLPQPLQEKLDHVYRYYGASLSWGEIQEYLNQTEPLDVAQISERIPTLEYWLSFFNEPGIQAVEQLKAKLQATPQPALTDTPPADFQPTTESADMTINQNTAGNYEYSTDNSNLQSDGNTFAPQQTSSSADNVNAAYDANSQAYDPNAQAYDSNAQAYDPNAQAYDPNAQAYDPNAQAYDPNAQAYDPNAQVYDPNAQAYDPNAQAYDPNAQTYDPNAQAYDPNAQAYNPNAPVETTPYQPEEPESNEQFLAKRAFRQLDFVNSVHAWIEARCIDLGKIEIYNYKHYGFLIDAMEQAKKDIQEVLASPVYYPALESVRPNGLKTLQNSLVALEKDLEIAYDNSPTESSPLVNDEIDSEEARKMLGMVDTSNQKEYLGPAPDGFEMIDDPYQT